MTQMAYRMIYCGWTLDEAEAEIARTFGLKEVNHGPDYRHMREFYAERVLPKRQKGESGTAAHPADSPPPPAGAPGAPGTTAAKGPPAATATR